MRPKGIKTKRNKLSDYDLDFIIEKIKNNNDGTATLKELNITRKHIEELRKIIIDNNINIDHWKRSLIRDGKVVYTRKHPVKEFLVEDSDFHPGALKRKLIEEGYLEYKCECCGISDWNNKPITLQLDHCNGIKQDNRIENLRLLCPICHANTDTFRGRNIKNKKAKKENQIDISS